MDRGTWWATVHGVAKSWTQLSDIIFTINVASWKRYWFFIIIIIIILIDVCLVTQSCLTLCEPMDCSPPGFSVHGILQARILEWVVIHFSKGSSQLRDQTQVSRVAGRFFTI